MTRWSARAYRLQVSPGRSRKVRRWSEPNQLPFRRNALRARDPEKAVGEIVKTCGLGVTLLEPRLLIRRVVRPGGRWRSGLRRGRGRRGGARSPHATGLGRLRRA